MLEAPVVGCIIAADQRGDDQNKRCSDRHHSEEKGNQASGILTIGHVRQNTAIDAENCGTNESNYGNNKYKRQGRDRVAKTPVPVSQLSLCGLAALNKRHVLRLMYVGFEIFSDLL